MDSSKYLLRGEIQRLSDTCEDTGLPKYQSYQSYQSGVNVPVSQLVQKQPSYIERQEYQFHLLLIIIKQLIH